MDLNAEAMASLHAEYAQEAAADLSRLEMLVGELENGAGGRKALSEMRRFFHGFAGSGATFGFPALSVTGSKGERLTLRLLATEEAPTAADLEELAAALAALRRELGEAQETRHADLSGRRQLCSVLLVTPDVDAQRSLAPLLRQAGYTMGLARDAAAARREIESATPAVLVVDTHLAAGSGYQLAEMVRQLPNGANVPILLLGPLGGRCETVAAVYSGASAMIERPCDWSEVVRRIGELRMVESDAGRILVVEDDARHAAFVRALLELEGCEVRWCADPQTFGAELEAFRPDLVLMDVLLPQTTGYDLVRGLRADGRHATLPVLFLTTEGEMGARIESVLAGGDDHLVKPVPPALLVSAVVARLERSRSLRARLQHDGLTGLLTHSAFLERARAFAAAAAANPGQHAVWAMIDLDHFKSVNDRFGHPAGDLVLSTMAAFLRRHVRRCDAVGRYGGEELAVLFEDLPASIAAGLIDLLRRESANLSFPLAGGQHFKVTWSAGLAALVPGMSWEQWRDAADQALYAAKRAGRNRVVAALETASGRASAEGRVAVGAHQLARPADSQQLAGGVLRLREALSR